MAKKSILFRSKERRDLQDVAALLHQLADSLENNELVLRQGERETRIEMPGSVQVKIKATEKAKRRHTKHTLAVKLAWRDDEEGYGHVTIG
ncbi:MAG: amphi-Trp domain-containing protein [Anaerolineae bacterium]